ncbi:MAG TPA: chromate transporter [Labilithrix sp.]
MRPTTAQIFRAFLVIGATSFGGGASAHIHEAVVRREKWMEEERFVEALTIARSLPGTNVTNLAAFVGARLGGMRGAVAAVLGAVLPGIVVVLALAAAYTRLSIPPESPLFRGALGGLTAGAVGVMASLVFDAAKPALRSGPALVASAAAFVALAVFHANMLLVLVVLVPIASLLARRKP